MRARNGSHTSRLPIFQSTSSLPHSQHLLCPLFALSPLLSDQLLVRTRTLATIDRILNALYVTIGHDEYLYIDLARSAHLNTSEYASSSSPEPLVASPCTSTVYASTSKRNGKHHRVVIISTHVWWAPSASVKPRSTQSTDTPKRRKTCNAFILFRSHAISEKLVTGCANMSEVSCRVAELWRSMSRDEQAPFYAKAAQEKTLAALGILPEPKPSRRRRTRATPKHKPEPLLPESPPAGESSSLCSPSTSVSSLSSFDTLSPSRLAVASPSRFLDPMHYAESVRISINLKMLCKTYADHN